MKALSLTQPWASAMAEGLKRNETRSWRTHYRGDLLICATLQKPRREEFATTVEYHRALTFPRGKAVCIVELCACESSKLFNAPHFDTPFGQLISLEEARWGNYLPGRWIWMTRNLRKIPEPWPVRGRQGLFEVELPWKNPGT